MVGVAQHTALFDTIAAVVAALVIIPACFSYGLDTKQDVWFGAKDTISKTYDAKFKQASRQYLTMSSRRNSRKQVLLTSTA